MYGKMERKGKDICLLAVQFPLHWKWAATPADRNLRRIRGGLSGKSASLGKRDFTGTGGAIEGIYRKMAA